MKKITFLIYILCSVYNGYSQIEELPFGSLPESIISDNWTGTAWEEQAVISSTFNAQCAVMTTSTSISGFVVNFVEYEYDTNNQLTTITTQSLNLLFMLENFSKTDFTYVSGNISEEIESLWNGSSWVLSTRTTYGYDTNDMVIEEIFQERNMSDTDWDNDSKTIYTFNNSGLLTEELFQDWNTNMNDWENSERILNMYTPSDLIDEEITQEWDDIALDWENVERGDYVYMGADIDEILYDFWDGTMWIPNEKDEYLYDTDQRISSITTSPWDGSAYVFDNRDLISYNSDDFVSEIIDQEYDGANWINESRITLTYPSCATFSVEDKEPIAIGIYPNPFKDEINIDVLNSSDIKSISIYNMTGQEVFYSKNSLSTINLNSLQSGMYILNLETLNAKKSFKIIKQ